MQLREFVLPLYASGVPETSICIRSGYATDEIGKFRRAFSKASGTVFATLPRMVSEYLASQSDFVAEPVVQEERELVSVSSVTRQRSSLFRDAVLRSHGAVCSCCQIALPELIEAAHIVPDADDGPDTPANGIPLCPTHHSAFDRHLFAFDPETRSLILKEGFDHLDLGISKLHLDAKVSTEALVLRLRLFNQAS